MFEALIVSLRAEANVGPVLFLKCLVLLIPITSPVGATPNPCEVVLTHLPSCSAVIVWHALVLAGVLSDEQRALFALQHSISRLFL